MKQIKILDNADFSLCRFTRGDKWVTPAEIQLASGAIITMQATATDQTAERAGLGNSKTAQQLWITSRPRWEKFQDVFEQNIIGDMAGDLFLANRAGTHMYCFLESNMAELYEKEIDLMYGKFMQRGLTTAMAIHKEVHPVFVTTEDYSVTTDNDTTIIYMLFPTLQKQITYALRDIENTVAVYKIFDRELIKKDKAFIYMDVALETFEFDLQQNPSWVNTVGSDIKVSLKEIIAILRVILQQRQLPLDAEAALTDFSDTYDRGDDTVTENVLQFVESFYNRLCYYTFYYDNDKMQVDDINLLQDKTKNAKAHLYFLSHIGPLEVVKLMSIVLILEMNALITSFEDIEENPTRFSIDHLLNMMKLLSKFGTKSDFDAIEVPDYFVPENYK